MIQDRDSLGASAPSCGSPKDSDPSLNERRRRAVMRMLERDFWARITEQFSKRNYGK